MIWWILGGGAALLLALVTCSWLFLLFKRRGKRSVHVFLEDPIVPTKELAERIAKQVVHDCEEVIRDSLLYMYSVVDGWPENAQQYAEKIVKKHKRWPKGNVVARCYWGAIEAGGKEYRWAVLQVVGDVKLVMQGD